MKKILKWMFFSDNKPFMPYIYSFIFILIIIIYLIARLISPLGEFDKIKISDTLIGILFANVNGLILISTWGKKKRYKTDE